MNKIICRKCGYETLHMGADCRHEQCEICGGEMYLKQDNEREVINELVNEDKTYTLEEVIEIDLIKSIEDTIKSIGHKRTWESIENIKNAKQRTLFRRGFLKAQGQIPESKIKFFNGAFWSNK